MESIQTKLHGQTTGLQTRIDLASMLTQEHFEQEREKIFRRAWLPFCHTDDLPTPGSYYVQDVPTFNTSLIAMRGSDNQIRVFHNACTHRGNKLLPEGLGSSRTLTCGFHGWVFSPEGALRHITDEHQFENVDKENYGLVPVTSEVWENFVFVNFDDRPRESLQDWLGPEFYARYDNGYFDQHENISTYSFIINANWHLGVNAFTEGYHTLYLHQHTARDYQGGKINPQRHRPHMELMRRHTRYSAPANPDHHVLPMESVAIKHGRKLLPAFDFDYSRLPSGVNPSRYEYWAFDVIEWFPNFVFLTGNHGRNEITFWPISADRTLIINRTYAYKSSNLGERLSRDYFRARGRDVAREDLSTLEVQHQMLKANVLPHVVLSRQETALKHHFSVAANMLAVN